MATEKKPSYKDINGTTRVGDFMRKAAEIGKPFAPALLELAERATGVKDFGNLADKIRADKDIPQQDKDVAIALIEKDKSDAQEETKRIIAEFDYETSADIQVTERWKADAESDSWLSKNTRPLIALSTVLLFWVALFLDSFEKIHFNIPESYTEIVIILLITVVGGYFGLKTIDKRTKAKYSTK